jgi:hypothetical protein
MDTGAQPGKEPVENRQVKRVGKMKEIKLEQKRQLVWRTSKIVLRLRAMQIMVD